MMGKNDIIRTLEALSNWQGSLSLTDKERVALTFAVEYIKKGAERPHGEWILCSERLPEECENVLAWIERDAWLDGNDYPTRKQEAAIGWHIEGRWHFDGYAGSTTECLAWMPLPEPYREEGERNEIPYA